MLKVGLTGGIGSGKSIAAHIFKVLGIPVFDADHQAKRLMVESEELRTALINQFGNEVYTGKQLNRTFLAGLVFSDPYKLEVLNAIVHPVTIAAADKWIGQQHSPYVMKEAALLFEAGSAAHLDIIVGVFAPVAVRIQRVMQRDQLTRDEIKTRMDRQIDDSIKMKLCDFILINDEQQLLIPQVIALHERLMEMGGKKKC